MAKDKRQKLVDFLDKKAFDVILRKRESSFKDEKLKKEFRDVKRSTESEKERFHTRYKTAEDVRANYLGDLNSKAAKKKNKELEHLGLPTLPSLRDEFMELCDKLGVKQKSK